MHSSGNQTRFWGFIFLVSGALLLGLLFFNSGISAVSKQLRPSISEVGPDGGAANVTTATQPIVTGFATAADSTISLFLDNSELVRGLIPVEIVDFEQPVWAYAFPANQALSASAVPYSLSATEIMANSGRLNSDPFPFWVLENERTIYLPRTDSAPPLPTATAIPSRPPTVNNGDFEDGATGWTLNGSGAAMEASVVDSGGIAGSSILLGNPNYEFSKVPVGFAEVKQTIVIPFDAETLHFDFRMHTEDRMFNPEQRRLFDTLEIYINGIPTDSERTSACLDSSNLPVTNGNRIVLCAGNTDEATEDSGPPTIISRSEAIALPATLLESQVEITFRVYNRVDGYWNSWAYIDNVRVE